MIIDVHAHYIPEKFVTTIKEKSDLYRAKIIKKEGKEHILHNEGYVYPLHNGFYNHDARMKDMSTNGIVSSVLSAAPPLFYYAAEDEIALKVARWVNDGIGEAISYYPERFAGMASIPMQNLKASIKELTRAVVSYNFKAVQIGATIEGTQLDKTDFRSFFKVCAELDLTVVIHPYYLGNKKGFEKYYLTNLIGNPLETTLTAAHLIYGGVFEANPDLKVLLVHGGGFFPYQLGRLSKGYSVREETKTNEVKDPFAYLTNIYFDSILFSPKALTFLVQLVGSEHVLFGTDYPFDMAENTPVSFLEATDLSEKEKKNIRENNSKKLFFNSLI